MLGLKPKFKWCLCISRWSEAKRKSKAPFVVFKTFSS
ncbi:DUF2237 family protein [Cellulophaga sp. L1A9]